jgi:hypothetical protein
MKAVSLSLRKGASATANLGAMLCGLVTAIVKSGCPRKALKLLVFPK